MRNTIVLVLMAVLFMSNSGQGDYIPVKDVEALGNRINEASAKTNTIMSDFVQEKHLEYLDAVIETTGKFWFEKVDKLRWEYVDPFNYIIVINNGKFIISTEGNTTEYDTESNKAFEKINDLIINSVSGNLLADESFTITAFENKDTYLINLIPKNDDMKNVLSNIEMTFDKSNLSVSQIVMRESEQDFTIIKFKNIKYNDTLPQDIFSIK